MQRIVETEMLDQLAPTDPLAAGSRADLRRLNSIMGHARAFADAILAGVSTDVLTSRPLRIAELGAGDGALLLQTAERLAARGVAARAELVDHCSPFPAENRTAFAALDWYVEQIAEDAFAWLGRQEVVLDVMLANLFLHHFPSDRLTELFRLAAAKTNLFIACEPRRSRLALAASRMVWCIGCNPVTRHDSVLSVRAGFSAAELTSRWPSHRDWQLDERRNGPFSHCFIAKRNA